MTTLIRRSPSQWQTLIEQQIESGLTATEFCNQQELSFNYFCKRKRAIKKPIEPGQPINRFIKLQAKSQSVPITESELVVHYQECRLHLATDIDPQWVAQLMKALS